MSWTLLLGLTLALLIALLAVLGRRRELERMAARVRERERAVRHGAAKAQLQHPVIDLSRCLGCGTCVAACPEDGVLALVHGQAAVVNGARCAGVSACERECPTGAITVTLTDLEERRDVPVLDERLEAVGTPGLFLAGEVTAHALIKTAIDHGTAVAAEVARRIGAEPGRDAEVLDLCIVGAGPAGLAASLEARRRGLRFATIDQEAAPGGTVARYPRRKLVVTRPIELPLHGRLARTTYAKEELVELWQRVVAEHDLPLHSGVTFQELERDADGTFALHTSAGTLLARNVCLALGRRGTPRRLEVPGEELAKVAYSLLDASSYQGRRLLVVGGGDSAVEAALGLAEQPGNEVTLSYRKEGFFRVRPRNEQRLADAAQRGRLRVVLASEVRAIHPEWVELQVHDAAGARVEWLPNDEVFVMAGGTAPLQLLERAGVSFDPALRPAQDAVAEQGNGLVRALGFALGVCLLAVVWAVWHADYYTLPTQARPAHPKHLLLRPGMGVGLALGICSALLVGVNLLYLARRCARGRWQVFSLRAWMTSHVATGILALLCATLHAAMAPRDTAGGHALWSLLALTVTGAIGRYLYAWVPRAANGRELELEEVKLRLARQSEAAGVGQQGFAALVQERVGALIEERQWSSTFAGRLLALLGGQRALRRLLADLAREGAARGVPADRIRELLALARTAHRTATAAAHLEDVRAVLSSWRYFHRWIAALLVLLLALHVFFAFAYGSLLDGGRP